MDLTKSLYIHSKFYIVNISRCMVGYASAFDCMELDPEDIVQETFIK